MLFNDLTAANALYQLVEPLLVPRSSRERSGKLGARCYAELATHSLPAERWYGDCSMISIDSLAVCLLSAIDCAGS